MARGRPKKQTTPTGAVPAQTMAVMPAENSDEKVIQAAELLKGPVLTLPDGITEEQKQQIRDAFDNQEMNTVHVEHVPNLSKPNDSQREYIEQRFDEVCAKPSDINQLLPYLRAVSDVCDHITEFGVRIPTSTWAFLAGNPDKLVSYDIVRNEGVDEVELVAPNFLFVLGNTLEVDIEETDFLFIDTHHKASQLSQELILHAHKVRKYIGFHDIFTFGFRDEADYDKLDQGNYGEGPGLWAALNPFLNSHHEWKIDFKTDENNGLLILRRV